MTGKKWFHWLGQLHGSRKQITCLSNIYPQWAKDAYEKGWWIGFNSVSETE